MSKGKLSNAMHVSNLLGVDLIARELGEMDEFQMQGAKLSQDAAPGWGPAPAPTGATATETTCKQGD